MSTHFEAGTAFGIAPAIRRWTSSCGVPARDFCHLANRRSAQDHREVTPTRIYTCRGAERTGPHSLEEIQARLEARALSPTDLAWYEGGQDWIPLSQVPGLKMPERSTPTRPSGPPPLPASVPPPLSSAAPLLRSAASPQNTVTSATPPPRTGLLIAAGVAAILLAFVLFGTGLMVLVGTEGGLFFLGLLMIPLSVGVGVLSIQFFMATSRNPTGCCKVCGHAKATINGSLNRHIGAVLLMFHSHITGHMCKGCIGEIFWKFTPLTLAAGWWGVISFFITPVVLINNTAYYIRSRWMK